jgi:hypothetical protein
LGQGKVGFGTTNPDEKSREYSYSSHGSSMLDSGNYYTRRTINSNRQGESVVINLKEAQIVGGVVTQGHKLTTNYMYTYNVQYKDEANKWHTISDSGAQDTANWNSGQYSKRCKDTPNWKSRRLGWWHGHRTQYSCSWFEKHRYCIRRTPPARGYLRYWWIGHLYGYPQHNCCACGKAPERRTCADYVKLGWCKDGHITFQKDGNMVSNFGYHHRYPSHHCTACGKGAKAFKGGQYDKKVNALFPTPVKATAIRIIVKTGYPVFRAALLVGKNHVDVQFAGTPWVYSVNFDFPHHPYKVLTSDNGKKWTLVKSGLNVPQFLFNPVLHTSYIRVDYQDETCDLYGGQPLTAEQIKSLGFKLVRRTGEDGGKHLHPAKDRLTGIAKYGTPCTGPSAETCNQDFSVEYKNDAYDEFLFTTGDLKHWLQTKKSQVLGWYENSARSVLCSSDSKSPHNVKWYRRNTDFDDPWISLKDYHYGEKDAFVSDGRRSSECARGGVHWYTYDDHDGSVAGRGTRRYLSKGDDFNGPGQSTLDNPRGWSSCEKNRGHWLQFDLGSVKKVKGITTQPRRDKREWLTAFKVRYAQADSGANRWQWAQPKKGPLFESAGWDGGDRNVKTKNFFKKVIEARYVRVYPVRWNSGGYPGTRADLIISSGNDPVFLYGGNKVQSQGKTRASREHKGLNVYIRMSPKTSASPPDIPVKYMGFTADPGKDIYPDSQVRIDACGDATKKRQKKEAAVQALGKVSETLSKNQKDLAENAEYLNTIKGIQSRIGSFQSDYNAAMNDTIDWGVVLSKAHLPLTTEPSLEQNTTAPPTDDSDTQEDGDDDDEEANEDTPSKEDSDENEAEKKSQEEKPDDQDDDEGKDKDKDDKAAEGDADKKKAGEGDADKKKADEARFRGTRKSSDASQLLYPGTSNEMF